MTHVSYLETAHSGSPGRRGGLIFSLIVIPRRSISSYNATMTKAAPSRPPHAPTHPRWRLLACDLDGTLIHPGESIAPADRHALEQARAHGIHVTICTGRNSYESRRIIAAGGFVGAGVFANGASVCDMTTGRSLTTACVPADIIDATIALFGELGHATLLLVDDPATGLPEYYFTQHAPPHRGTQEWMIYHKAQARVVETLSPELKAHTLRLSVVVSAGEAVAVEARVAVLFGPRITHHSIYSATFDCQVIEVFAAHVDKWTGLLRLCELMDIPPTAVVTIGDDVNDLAMLTAAPLSFAMANGSPKAKAAAKHTTGSLAEHGVAQAIAQLLRADA